MNVNYLSVKMETNNKMAQSYFHFSYLAVCIDDVFIVAFREKVSKYIYYTNLEVLKDRNRRCQVVVKQPSKGEIC